MLAPMRFFARVCAYVNGQSAALDEALVAVTPGANVRTVIGVYTVVPDEVGFAIELLQWEADQVSLGKG